MAAENTWVSGSEQSYLDLHPCMREAGVGRVLVASLHQGIADVLPARLNFYENWLDAEGLREGTIGLAPLYAVLSFLRQEGEAYGTVTTSAGEYAAEWTVESMGSLERSILKRAPELLRPRLVLRLADRLVHSSYRQGRLAFKLRKGTATLDLRASVFCDVREPVGHALCRFYAAAFARLFKLFEVPATVEVTSCRATGSPACAMKVTIAATH
jgi:predicted hydrocarbon binding protein